MENGIFGKMNAKITIIKRKKFSKKKNQSKKANSSKIFARPMIIGMIGGYNWVFFNI